MMMICLRDIVFYHKEIMVVRIPVVEAVSFKGVAAVLVKDVKDNRACVTIVEVALACQINSNIL